MPGARFRPPAAALPDCGTARGLDRHPLINGSHVAGQVGQVRVGRQIAFRFCTLEAFAYPFFTIRPARSQFPPDRLGFLSPSKRIPNASVYSATLPGVL